MKYIIANWKENKNLNEAMLWLGQFIELSKEVLRQNDSIKIVICPPFPLIIPASQKLQSLKSKLPITNYQLPILGSQNISRFEQGAYTGEVSVSLIKDFVNYAIIGHSERRKYFGETNEVVNQKIRLCLKYNLTPIVCVANLKQTETVSSQQLAASRKQTQNDLKIQSAICHLPSAIIAYEPIEAIGTGQPDTPEHAQKMAEKIKKVSSRQSAGQPKEYPPLESSFAPASPVKGGVGGRKIKEVAGGDTMVIYGGSVTSQNVNDFIRQKDIDGVLVGESSLDVEEFFRIIKQVYSVDAKT